MSEVAFCFPIVRVDFLPRALETLYKYTEVDFRVFVVDQSLEGLDKDFIKKYIHYYIRPFQNLGFAKAGNEMLWTAYRQGYPYMAICNDDIEYMNKGWWQGIKDTFAMNDKILLAAPMSPKEGGWGYGLTGENNDTWIPPKGFIRDPQDDRSILPERLSYKENFTDEDYNYLVNEHPHWQKNSLCDGMAMWHPVFKREALEKVGYLDERFLYGKGEDYDYMARVYRLKYRAVSTTKSWVWHHWGQSTEKLAELPPELFNRPQWNNLDELWVPEENEGNHIDPWGFYTSKAGIRTPLKRVSEVRIDPI